MNCAARLSLAIALAAAAGARAQEPVPCQGDERIERKGLGALGRAVRLGLVADAREALPLTLANLERFATVFRRERVAAVLVLGGMGATEDEIARTLEALKGAQAPLFALPGDREPVAAFHAAVARARRAGIDVTDLATVRAVAGDGVALVALAGSRFRHELAPGGCRPDDAALAEVTRLEDWAKAGGKPVVLIAHTPPRGRGPEALDWSPAGGNDGDVELARLVPSWQAQVMAFAGVDADGGRLLGSAGPVPEGAWAERLYANVGAADAVTRALAGGGWSHGQALLVELDGGKARAKVVR